MEEFAEYLVQKQGQKNKGTNPLRGVFLCHINQVVNRVSMTDTNRPEVLLSVERIIGKILRIATDSSV